MPYPHLATLLGAVVLGAVAVLRRRSRSIPVRVVAGLVAAVIGAAFGALVDAADTNVLDLLPAVIGAANLQFAEIDWRRVVGDALTNPAGLSMIVGGVIVVAGSVALSFGGLAFVLRSVFRRTAIWMGAGIALIASAAVLVVTKIPFAREEGGWMLVAGAMIGAGLVNGRLFSPGRGIYWELPSADPAFERTLLSMRPPPVVAWLFRQFLPRVLRAPAGEVDQAMSSMDQGIGQSMAAEPQIPKRLRNAADVDVMLAALRAKREGPMAQELRRQRVLIAAMVAGAAVLLLVVWLGIRS